ncbi:MAG: DUF11 domain-containing protein, partial [Lachnospiraceae bacterium]|nr:DUF11 domain-containing protein [Lachnospiraceae bacterium]
TYDPDAKTVTLAEGETVVLTATYTVTVTDSKLVNTVIVGDADDTNPPEDTVTTEVENHGSLSVTKTADAAVEYMVGNTVIYTITVENTGNCTITNIEVVDSLAGAVFEKGSGYMVDSSGKTAVIASLAEGEVVPLTVSYIVTESDVVVSGTSGTAAVEIYNKATATGEDPDGNPVTDSGDVWLPYEKTNAAWTVTKTVSGMSGEIDETTGVQMAVVGDTLVYTITVANTGNVIINKTLTDTFTVDGKEIRLSLTKTSGSGSYDSATGLVMLGVGETVVLTSTYTVTAAGCKLVNSVLVGDPDDPETPGDEVTIDVENEESWTVEKTVSGMSGEVDETTGAQKAVVGDTLTYTITIANTGTVAIAKNVTDIFTVNGETTGLTLSKSSGSGTYNSASGQVILEAGETIVLTSTYTVTATDNSLVNAVTVGDEDDTNPPGDEVTTEVEDAPQLELVKETTSTPADGEAYALGEVITYRITLTNVGNVTITDIVVEDILTGNSGADAWTVDALEPGESVEFTTSYTVTEADIIAGSVVNEATADGFVEEPDPTEEPTEETEEARTEDPTQDPDAVMTLVKETTSVPADGEAYALGEEITYKITVTNVGNLTLTELVVEDALTGNSGDNAWRVDSLAPGESVVFTTSYIVTEADVLAGSVTNEATASAVLEYEVPDDLDDPVIPEDPEDGKTVDKTKSEDPDETETSDQTTETETETSSSESTQEAPQTGDETPIRSYLLLMLCAVGILFAEENRRRRRYR